MSQLRFWELWNQNNTVLRLDWATGEALQTHLDKYRESNEDPSNKTLPMFWTGEDIEGAPITVRIDFIRDLQGSTPEIRAKQDDPEGVCEQIRAMAIHASKKRWSADPDKETFE